MPKKAVTSSGSRIAKELVEKVDLPNPRRIGDRGTSAPFRAVDPPSTTPAWLDNYAGRPVRNQHLAGQNHPVTGVPFDSNGFPDFSAHRHPDVDDVRINLTGNRNSDFAAANRQAGLPRTPDGYTWHHHQDPGLMQLVDRDIHRQTGHTGGFSGGK